MNKQDEQRYQLFGRRSYEEPLAYVRTVTEVPDVVEAEWVELVAAPETAIIRVIPWRVIPWHVIPWEEKDE